MKMILAFILILTFCFSPLSVKAGEKFFSHSIVIIDEFGNYYEFYPPHGPNPDDPGGSRKMEGIYQIICLGGKAQYDKVKRSGLRGFRKRTRVPDRVVKKYQELMEH